MEGEQRALCANFCADVSRGRPLKKHVVVPAWCDDSLDAGSPLNEDGSWGRG